MHIGDLSAKKPINDICFKLYIVVLVGIIIGVNYTLYFKIFPKLLLK